MLKYDRRALRRHTYARARERTHAQTVERGSWSRHRFTYARNNGGARHRRTFRSPLVAEPAPLRSSFSLALRRRVTRARDITELQPWLRYVVGGGGVRADATSTLTLNSVGTQRYVNDTRNIVL